MEKRKIVEEEFLNELYMRIEMLNGQGYSYEKIAQLFSNDQVDFYKKLIERNDFRWKKELVELFEKMSEWFVDKEWKFEINETDMKKYCEELFASIYDLTRELGISDKRTKRLRELFAS